MNQRQPDGPDEDAHRHRVRRRWAPLLVGVLLAVLGVMVVAGRTSGDPAAASSSTPASAADGIPLVIGAVPYWDEEAARQTIEDNHGAIDVASPWSYAVTSTGAVELQPDLKPAGEQALATRLRELGIKVIPTIANTTDGLWDPDTVSTVIRNAGLRRAHVQSVVALVDSKGFDGIQIDYEDLTPADRLSFSAFVTDLSKSLHDIGKVLYVTVHVKEDDKGYDQRNQSQDYAAIGKAADLVCLMAYDWHWGTGPSGPIAPYDWVERVIRYSVTQIPANKIVLGVGLFGYDWVESKAENLTWRQVVALAADKAADEKWDVGGQSPHFSYTLDGVQHEVWYENGRSVAAKFSLAQKYRLGGVELWRLGGEDPTMWEPGP